MKKRLFLILLLLLSWACSAHKTEKVPESISELKNLTAYPANVKPKETISFKKDAVYGNSKEVLIGRIGDVAVDSLGQVFIADVQKQTIDVFEPDGRFLTYLGRSGPGPGEFSYIKSLQIRNDLLYAFDSNFGIRRVNIFTLDTLAYKETILIDKKRGKYKLLEKAYPGIYKIYVRNNGTYLAEFIANSFTPNKEWQNVEMKGMLYPLDRTGEIVSDKPIEFMEEIRTFKWGLIPIKAFWGNAFTVLTSDNTIFWSGPDHFLIKVYRPNGVYQRAFYYPHKKILLTQASAIKTKVPDLLIKNMKFMKLHRTWPVLMRMKIDNQDRLWVATVVQNMKVYQWWVLNPNGKLIARFNWPRGKPIKVIKNGYIYTQEKDTAAGISKIVRYKIAMK